MSPAAEISVERALSGYQGKGNGSFAEDSVMLPLMGDFIHDFFFEKISNSIHYGR